MVNQCLNGDMGECGREEKEGRKREIRGENEEGNMVRQRTGKLWKQQKLNQSIWNKLLALIKIDREGLGKWMDAGKGEENVNCNIGSIQLGDLWWKKSRSIRGQGV